MSFALEGFAPVKEQNLTLRVGQTAKLARDDAGSRRARRSPSARPCRSSTSTRPTRSTNIVPEQIESLPVPDRDFQRLAFIAPGVQRERGGFRFINGGPVIGAGGNASQSTILVNGVDFTDQVHGLSPRALQPGRRSASSA